MLGWFVVGFLFAFALFALCVGGLENDIPRTWLDAGKGKITDVYVGSGTLKLSAYHFEALSNEADKISGISYGNHGLYINGDEVTLQKAGNRYRVQGLKLTMADVGVVSMFVGLGLLFGGIGLYYFPIYSWFAGSKAIRLLEYGTATNAKYVGKTPTGIQIHDRQVMKVDFEYSVDENSYMVSARAYNLSRLTDTKNKVVFYDPMQPEQAIVFDGLPRGIYLDEGMEQFRVNPMHCAPPFLAATFVCGEIIAIIILTVRAF